MRAVAHLRVRGVQGVGRAQRGPDLVGVVRAGFPEEVACELEPDAWVKVS